MLCSYKYIDQIPSREGVVDLPNQQDKRAAKNAKMVLYPPKIHPKMPMGKHITPRVGWIVVPQVAVVAAHDPWANVPPRTAVQRICAVEVPWPPQLGYPGGHGHGSLLMRFVHWNPFIRDHEYVSIIW